MQQLNAMSNIGRQCTKLFLDWQEGKISKEKFLTILREMNLDLTGRSLPLPLEGCFEPKIGSKIDYLCKKVV